MTSNLRYHIALITANLLFGVNYSYISSTIKKVMSADDLFYARIVCCALIFMPYIFLKGAWRVKKSDIVAILTFAALVTAGRQYLLINSLNYISPMDSSIISTLGPVLIMIISAVMLGEKMFKKQVVGMILAFVGAVFIVVSTGAKGGSDSIKGVVMMLISVAAISINTIHAKGVLAKYNPITIVGWSSLVSAVVAAPMFLDNLLHVDTSNWSSSEWGEVGYILVGGTIIATALLYYGLKHLSATSVSVYFYVQPIVATIFAIIRGQDKMTLIFVISAAMIFMGVGLIQRSAVGRKS